MSAPWDPQIRDASDSRGRRDDRVHRAALRALALSRCFSDLYVVQAKKQVLEKKWNALAIGKIRVPGRRGNLIARKQAQDVVYLV